MADAAFALVGAVAGYLLKIAEGWLGDARAARKDRAERRREFERTTLLELQEAMANLARAAGEIHHFDSMQLRNTGQRTQVPREMDEREFQARRRLAMLRERVLDDELRRLVGEFADATVAVEKVALMRGPEAESDARMMDAIAVQDRAYARLGVVLRGLF